MREHYVNELDNFIGGWYLEDPLIDEIIEFHKNSDSKEPGKQCKEVRPNIKDSTDCKLDEKFLHDKYCLYRRNSVLRYIDKYPICNTLSNWMEIMYPQIQHYKPGQAFHGWHSERGVGRNLTHFRHLVYMTYLNDVTDEGETEFYHQKIKIKPERGLTLIWPSDWTFTHRGITSPTQEKYIVTGWFYFV